MNPLDDPRLTAYALGELDESERAEVEAILATSEEARREVEETRAAAAELTRELAGEASAAPGRALSPERRDAIDAVLRSEVASAGFGSRRGANRLSRLLGITALAAALVLGVSFLWQDRVSMSPRGSLGSASEAKPRGKERAAYGEAEAPDAGRAWKGGLEDDAKSEGVRRVGALDDDEKRAVKLTAGSQPAAAAAKPDANTFFLAPESSGKPNDSDRGEELRRLPGGVRGKDGESEATIGVVQSEAKSADDRFAGEIGGRHKDRLSTDGASADAKKIAEPLGGAGGGKSAAPQTPGTPAATKPGESKESLSRLDLDGPATGTGQADPKAKAGAGRYRGPADSSPPKNQSELSVRGLEKAPDAKPNNQANETAFFRYQMDDGRGGLNPSQADSKSVRKSEGKAVAKAGNGAPAKQPVDSLEELETAKELSQELQKQKSGDDRNEVAKKQVRDLSDIELDVQSLLWEQFGVTSGSRQLGAQSYAKIIENRYKRVTDEPLSTFSIDVDTASYANIRRFLNEGTLPPPAAVRVEELLNYFSYTDPTPKDNTPFAVRLEVAATPWNSRTRLVRIGIKGREVPKEARKPSNFVFLVDVSGSMAPEDRLPLLRDGMRLLVKELTENDNVAIVTYAGESGLALPSTNAGDPKKILGAIDGLQAGGSTNGASGIQLAYEQAASHFLKGGVNRVILMTDGDFNVGVTEPNDLDRLIQEKAKSGVFLSVLGVGRDNLKDDRMERLADKGHGNYAYIDSLKEARKVLVDQMNSTLVTIAKDVKLQVEFNPKEVGAFRQIGYENREMPHQDFNNDAKEAGDVGAGHSLTVLYEVLPKNAPALAMDNSLPAVDPLKYQQQGGITQKSAREKELSLTEAANSGEMLTVKIRYKEPEGKESALLEFPLKDRGLAYAKASEDFKFSAAVAAFGMILRGSQYKGTASFDSVLELGEEAKGSDPFGYRREFLDLVAKARALAKR